MRLGAREVPAYDLAGSGCAGFLLALDVAQCTIERRTRRKKMLVVGAELLTRLMNWEDRNTCVLFGDAAAAMVIGHGAPDVGRDSRPPLRVRTAARPTSSASRRAARGSPSISGQSAEKGLHHDIVMKGREVFREAVQAA